MTNSLFLMLALLAGLTQAASARCDDFTPIVGWDEQIFPSFVISTATIKNPPWVDEERTDILGEKGGLLGVNITSPGKKSPIKVTITCDEIMEPSTFSGNLPEKDVEYSVFPRIKYRYSKLAEISQATPVSMTFKVQIGKDEATEQTATVTIRPINDCPFMVQAGETQIDISPTFAAYVNEQHPFLDKVLREALDFGYVDSFSGYQGDEAEVIRQVYAIWDALVTRDVKYSSITATSVNADTVWCQHVRMIEQSLNNSQANCVDGSVLMASLLRKVGIEPFLVLVPGHCYVGFYVDKEQTKLMAIETTLLGSTVEEDEEYASIEILEEAIDEEIRDEFSWPTFCNAIAVGSKNFEESKEKFADKNEPEYVVIDIATARKHGILPIAFKGKEKFVGVGDGVVAEEEEEEEEEE